MQHQQQNQQQQEQQLTDWQQLLAKGNQCYELHQWSQAQHFYLEALELLAQRNSENPTCVGTLMAWIGTCHNLSTLHEHIGDLQQALVYLQLPYQHCRFQLEFSECEGAQLVALKSINLCWSAIGGFAQRYSEFMKSQKFDIELAQTLSLASQQLH